MTATAVKIMAEDDRLTISLRYHVPATKEEVDASKRYYQKRFSERAGRPIPIEEIKVNPEEGELQEVTTYFTVGKNKPLDPLNRIPQSVLRSLIEKLNDFKDGDLDTKAYAIQEIQNAVKFSQ